MIYLIIRDPNGYVASGGTGDWPLYSYPERAHIVLDVFNKSTGIAHRADYCHFWEQYVPILLEEFGKLSFSSYLLFDFFPFRTMRHSWTIFEFIKRKIFEFIEQKLVFTHSLPFHSSYSSIEQLLTFVYISLLSVLPLLFTLS